jgi:CRISPR system Cascade subunit CasE
MSELHLVHLPIALKPLRRWAAERGFGWAARDGRGRASGGVFDEGCALHHLLSETFGKSVLQPFRLFVTPGQLNGSLYAYTLSNKETLVETACESAMPETLAICDPTQLAAKRMPMAWKEGRRLAFDIRVRPVRRLLKAGGAFAKGAEVDAFLVEALRCFPTGPPVEKTMLDAGRTREAVYADWLAERLEGAAKVERAGLARFFRNRAAREGCAPEGPDATQHGELVVRDPDKFAQCLARGIGRHAAYGYGMLLLRPEGRN